MVTTLTEDQIRSGESLIKALDASGMDIAAAYWFRKPGADVWKLGISERHLASSRDFYEKVREVMTNNGKSDLPLEEIVALRPKEPILRLLGKVFRTGRSIARIQSSNNTVNGVLLPDMLIYRVA